MEMILHVTCYMCYEKCWQIYHVYVSKIQYITVLLGMA